MRKLATILSYPRFLWITAGITGLYLILFLIALQEISLGGHGFSFVCVDWAQMLDRTGTVTFEAIAMVTVPGLTIIISPLNILIGLVISVLVGLNLMITYIAYYQPRACSFNRSTGVLASFPALLAGGACCAPAIILILGIQVSSLMMTVFQVLIPVAIALLLLTLKLILDRTDPALLQLNQKQEKATT